MEEWQRQYIQKHITKLIRDTSCNVQLISELQSSGMINYVDIDILTSLKGSYGPTSQADHLYRILQQRRNGYENMITALRDSHQTGAMKILLGGYHTNGKANPFMEIDYSAILSAEVNFQGVTSQLTQLFPPLTTGDLKEILSDSQALIDYSGIFEQKSKEFVLAVDTIPNQPEHYIPRYISNQIKLNPAIFKVPCEDVFVFEGLDRVTLTQLAHPTLTSGSDKQLLEVTSRYIYLEHDEDWQEICNICKNPVHLIKYEAGEYIVKDSSGGSNVLRKYLIKSCIAKDVYVSESEFLDKLGKIGTKRGVCICETPGMGKTMLLASPARSIKQRHPERIIVFIRLSEFTQKMTKDIKETLPEFDSSLKLILEQITDISLSAAGLGLLIKRHGVQLELFFDGLDEVPSESLNSTKQFIHSLVSGSEKITIYVTSRPHVRSELETTLGVIAFEILPFTQKNQADFLVEFWRRKLSPPFSEVKLMEFSKLCLKSVHENLSDDERDIMGIPLQCFLLAEVYTKEARLHACSNRQHNFSPQRSTTLYQMYKNFVDLRLSRCDPILRRKAKKVHVLMALMLLFPEIAKTYAKNSPSPFKTNLLSYGIVEQREILGVSSVTFIHRTIAEFLVAEYVGDLMFAENKSLLQRVFHWRDIRDERIIMEHFSTTVFANAELNIIGQTGNFGYAVIMYFINSHIKSKQLDSINVLFAKTLVEFLTPLEFHNTLGCFIFQNQLYLARYLMDIIRLEGTYLIREFWRKKFSATQNLFGCGNEKSLGSFLRCALDNSNVALLNEIFGFYKEFAQVSDFSFASDDATPLHTALKSNQKNYEVIDCLVKHLGTNHPKLLYEFLDNLVVYSNSKMEIGKNEQLIFDLLQKNSRQSNLGTNKFQKALCFPWNHLNRWKYSLNIIKFLVQEGADLFATNDNDENIIHVTARYFFENDFLELCRYFQEQCDPLSDLDVNFLSAKNKCGQSPLHIRLVSPRVATELPTVKYFLNIPNVKVNDEDVYGENLFLAAVRERERKDILELLVNCGANVNTYNKKHENALHLAVQATPLDYTPIIVEYLISLGICTHQQNVAGNSPCDLAKSELENYKTYCFGSYNYDQVCAIINNIIENLNTAGLNNVMLV